MRPLESYVVYLALYAVWGDSAPGSRWALWLLLTVFVAHILLERPRWQLAALYAQVMHLLYVAFIAVPSETTETTWTFVTLSTIGILLSSALACLMPIAKFPELTGRFQSVGVVHTFVPTAGGSSDHQHAHPEIGITVFYPSALAAPTRSGAQFLDPNTLTAFSRIMRAPGPFFGHLALAKIRAVNDLPIATASATTSIPSKFPVIVFSHGLSGVAGTYAMQASDLASHGYIVVTPTHNDGSACLAELSNGHAINYVDGVYGEPETVAIREKQLQVRIEEVIRLIEMIGEADEKDGEGSKLPFANRLDSTRIGLVGHSFGGATVLGTAARNGVRIQGIVSHDVWLDPVPQNVLDAGLKNIPALHTLSEQWYKWTSAKDRTIQFAKESGESTQVISFPGTAHSNYSDVPLFAQVISRKLKQIGPKDFRQTMNNINKAQTEFLDKHIKGEEEGEKKQSSSPPSSPRMFDALLKSKDAFIVPHNSVAEKQN